MGKQTTRYKCVCVPVCAAETKTYHIQTLAMYESGHLSDGLACGPNSESDF